VFVYSGSAGTWYGLDDVLRFFQAAAQRWAGARLVILSRNREEVGRALAGWRFPDGSVEVGSAAHDEMPDRLAHADAGVAFYKPGMARQGTSPTKVGEYLAMGLPVIVNQGVGDVDELVRQRRVGIVVKESESSGYLQALQELQGLWADAGLATRCREAAVQYCSLEVGVERYHHVYQRVTRRAQPGPYQEKES
jgi:glycosyltransferase involved in cell wall biosynthesis